jgi:hypothetical protein
MAGASLEGRFATDLSLVHRCFGGGEKTHLGPLGGACGWFEAGGSAAAAISSGIPGEAKGPPQMVVRALVGRARDMLESSLESGLSVLLLSCSASLRLQYCRSTFLAG